MRVLIQFFLVLIITNFVFFSPVGMTTCQCVKESLSYAQDSADFLLNITAPEHVSYDKSVNITVVVQLKDTAATMENILLELELEDGLSFLGDENGSRSLGSFIPGDKSVNIFSVYSPESYMTNPTVIVRAKIYQNEELLFVETPDGIQSYGVIAITIDFPILGVTGPIELKDYVVPRLRLLADEEAIITFNISNSGKVNIYNLTFRIEIDEPDYLQVINLTRNSLDILEAESIFSVVFKVRCLIDYRSLSRVYFYVDCEIMETYGLVVKVETYDWFNAAKYDNPVAVVVWPIVLLFQLIALVYLIISIKNKRTRKRKLKEELEEKYGKAMYESDF